MVGPGTAELGPFLREHSANLIDSLEIAVAKAIEPVTDFELKLKVV
jgi:hypothetical protein